MANAKSQANSQRAKELRKLGYNAHQIASMMGNVTTRTVYRWLGIETEDEAPVEVIAERATDIGISLLKKQIEAGELSGDELTRAINTLHRTGIKPRRKDLESSEETLPERLWYSWLRGPGGLYYDETTAEPFDSSKVGVAESEGGYGNCRHIVHCCIGCTVDLYDDDGNLLMAK